MRPPTLASIGVAGAATGVGSLPLSDADEALAMVARRCAEVPFWPQLTGEAMISQSLGGLERWLTPRPPGFVVHDRMGLADALAAPGPWSKEEAGGLVALEAQLGLGALPQARLVKGQLTGPLTLAACLRVDGQPAWQDRSFLLALGERVARQATDQLSRLGHAGHPVLLVLDEPMLGLVPPEVLAPGAPAVEALTHALGAAQAGGGMAGIHCCSAPPWEVLARLPQDLVSFDAHQHLDGLRQSAAGLAWILRHAVIWGLVPTVDHAPLPPEVRAEAWWRSMAEVTDPDALLPRALFSPACGLQGLAPEVAEARLSDAARIGALLAPRGPGPG